MAGKHARPPVDDPRTDQPQQPASSESEILSILDARRARRA